MGPFTLLVTTLTHKLTLWLVLDLPCTHGLVITGLRLILFPTMAEAIPEKLKQEGNHYLWEMRGIFINFSNVLAKVFSVDWRPYPVVTYIHT